MIRSQQISFLGEWVCCMQEFFITKSFDSGVSLALIACTWRGQRLGLTQEF
jgi:hypothetical protein